MIAFIIEHDVSITETGQRIVRDLRVRINRLKAVKTRLDISLPPDSLVCPGTKESTPVRVTL
jgi:hypothetical protein